MLKVIFSIAIFILFVFYIIDECCPCKSNNIMLLTWPCTCWWPIMATTNSVTDLSQIIWPIFTITERFEDVAKCVTWNYHYHKVINNTFLVGGYRSRAYSKNASTTPSCRSKTGSKIFRNGERNNSTATVTV